MPTNRSNQFTSSFKQIICFLLSCSLFVFSVYANIENYDRCHFCLWINTSDLKLKENLLASHVLKNMSQTSVTRGLRCTDACNFTNKNWYPLVKSWKKNWKKFYGSIPGKLNIICLTMIVTKWFEASFGSSSILHKSVREIHLKILD